MNMHDLPKSGGEGAPSNSRPPTGYPIHRPTATPIGGPPSHDGPPGYQPYNRVTMETSSRTLISGVLLGLLAAAVGGAVWYGVVVLAERQITYLAIALGVLIGLAVTWGSGRRGASTMVASAVIALLAVITSYYFITRYFIIDGGKEVGVEFDIPIIPSFQVFKEVLRLGFEAASSQYLYCAMCIGSAAYMGFKGPPQNNVVRR